MATNKGIFRGTRNQDISHAVGMSAYASPFFVLHDDATDATVKPLDPISQMDSTAGATDADNIRQVVVPNAYYYLNLCLGWTSDNIGAAITTPPTVYVFGLLPREQRQDRAYPEDDLAAATNVPTLEGDNAGGRFWVPLLPEGGASGSPITLNGGLDMEVLVGTDVMGLSKPISIYLAGTRRIMCTVGATAAGGDGNVDSIFIGGWLSG